MKEIKSTKAPEPVGLYPHAKKVGSFLYLSGVGPRKRGSKEIPGVKFDDNGNIASYDIAEQCHSVFQNVKFVLEDCGAKWGDLVDVTVFLTSMRDDFDSFNKLYTEYFKNVQPTRTTVEVTSLPTPIAIELKCIAYLKSD